MLRLVHVGTEVTDFNLLETCETHLKHWEVVQRWFVNQWRIWFVTMLSFHFVSFKSIPYILESFQNHFQAFNIYLKIWSQLLGAQNVEFFDFCMRVLNSIYWGNVSLGSWVSNREQTLCLCMIFGCWTWYVQGFNHFNSNGYRNDGSLLS